MEGVSRGLGRPGQTFARLDCILDASLGVSRRVWKTLRSHFGVSWRGRGAFANRFGRAEGRPGQKDQTFSLFFFDSFFDHDLGGPER